MTQHDTNRLLCALEGIDASLSELVSLLRPQQETSNPDELCAACVCPKSKHSAECTQFEPSGIVPVYGDLQDAPTRT